MSPYQGGLCCLFSSHHCPSSLLYFFLFCFFYIFLSVNIQRIEEYKGIYVEFKEANKINTMHPLPNRRDRNLSTPVKHWCTLHRLHLLQTTYSSLPSPIDYPVFWFYFLLFILNRFNPSVCISYLNDEVSTLFSVK